MKRVFFLFLCAAIPKLLVAEPEPIGTTQPNPASLSSQNTSSQENHPLTSFSTNPLSREEETASMLSASETDENEAKNLPIDSVTSTEEASLNTLIEASQESESSPPEENNIAETSVIPVTTTEDPSRNLSTEDSNKSSSLDTSEQENKDLPTVTLSSKNAEKAEDTEEESEESLGDIMDLRPAVPLKISWNGPIALLFLFFSLLLLWFLLRRKKKTKKTAKLVEKPLDPYTEVTQALQKCTQLLQDPDPKPFAFAIDEAIRLYLSRIFPLPAPESTTQEMLHHLTICTRIPPSLRETITHFLQQCDLIKFTKLSFDEPFLIQLHQQASSIVQTSHALTQPQPETSATHTSTERKSS